MANHFTAAETHHFDQHMAQARDNLAAVLRDWRDTEVSACCTEHAIVAFGDHIAEQVETLGPGPVGLMLIVACQKLP